MYRKVAALLFLLLPAATSSAAMRTEPLLLEGYRQMYDLDFRAAQDAFAQYMRQHPDDPLGPVSAAAAHLFAEFDRLHILQGEFFQHDENFSAAHRLKPDPAAAQLFERRLAQGQELARGQLAVNANNTNALFASMLARGLRSDYDGLIEHRYLRSLQTIKEGRRLAGQLLALDPSYHDAWVAIGIENYMLSLKPLPVRWILQLAGNATDREYGLQKLRITAQQGTYLKPFAQLLFAVAALRDKRTGEARSILSSLAAEFPRNHLYREELVRLNESAPLRH